KKISLLKWIVRSRVYRPQKASLRRRELSGAATEYRRSNTLTPLSRNWSRQNSGHDSITTSSEVCNHRRGKRAGAIWPLSYYVLKLPLVSSFCCWRNPRDETGSPF